MTERVPSKIADRALKPGLGLPDLQMPIQDGWMPLTAAAQWIATRGGQVSFAADDASSWAPAFDALLAAIASAKVRVVGTPNGWPDIPIPLHHFVDCPVEYPFEETHLDRFFDGPTHLRAHAAYSKEEWEDPFHDSLIKDGEVLWSRLLVSAADVRTCWPFKLADPKTSGAIGRPTSIHLVRAQLQQRAQSGEMLPSLKAESRLLSNWLAVTHPHTHQIKPRSLENSIRAEFRALLQNMK